MGDIRGSISGKRAIFGVGINAVTLGDAVETILDAARSRHSFGISALAVHGLIEATRNREVRAAVDALDLVLPDGQPVRWALRALHQVHLPNRVYGPDLMRKLCAAAASEGIGIYLFGSTHETCSRLVRSLESDFPGIRIVDVQPDRFRDASPEEDIADVDRINGSGAGMVFVGRGCPRQEKWVAAHLGRVQAPMIAIGAAFDFLSGQKIQAPRWMQDHGLEWLFRLIQEPRRLWRRYLITNSLYFFYLGRECIGRLYRQGSCRLNSNGKIK
jgi:N-acetylglucosaminyldiphosphoundecaprenol N-acetyl-beta-D-mannosaminyltransferase